MTEGIRVDKPRELAEWQAVPKDLLAWKQLGNDYFGVLSARNQGRGGLACYQRALRTAKVEIQTLAVLLNILAICRLKTGDFTAATQLAGAAAHLNPEYLKAWLRLASSLVEAGRLETGNHRGGMTAVRVVAYASSVLSNLTPQQQQMLE
jgi:Flp pilus assembly protein TadD